MASHQEDKYQVAHFSPTLPAFHPAVTDELASIYAKFGCRVNCTLP
jgi:hypothetical protein